MRSAYPSYEQRSSSRSLSQDLRLKQGCLGIVLGPTQGAVEPSRALKALDFADADVTSGFDILECQANFPVRIKKLLRTLASRPLCTEGRNHPPDLVEVDAVAAQIWSAAW